MTADGFATRRGRRARAASIATKSTRRCAAAAARGCSRRRPAARFPEVADYRVVLDPDDTFIGTLNEDFAIESNAGDVFQLGNASWRVLQVAAGDVRVADAKGAPPTIPFWLGEAPARSDELSRAVSDLRARTSIDALDDRPQRGATADRVAWMARDRRSTGTPPSRWSRTSPRDAARSA